MKRWRFGGVAEYARLADMAIKVSRNDQAKMVAGQGPMVLM